MLVGAQHTETVRRAIDFFQEGNVDALVALYHPDVEVVEAGAVRPPAHTYVGVENARDYVQELVDKGANVRVEDVELVDLDDTVIVHLRVPVANMAMRWRFDFEGDLIARVVPLEAGWAALGGHPYTLAEVVEPPASGSVALRLSDGRSLAAPIAIELEPLAPVQEPVLVYFEGDELAGWYLPDHQRGMDLR